MRKCWQCI